MLQLHKLTMRFGGLTAVSDVDLEVPKGSIFSVIGPNGAGKTTVFNAITGIYEPTSGTIRCDGRELRRPFTWRVVLACLAIGLATSIAALFLSLDINQLWRATIIRNMQNPFNRFTYTQSWHDFRGYMDGRVAVERWNDRRWAVVPWNASRPILAWTVYGDNGTRLLALSLDQAVDGKITISQARPPSWLRIRQNWKILATQQTIDEIAQERANQLRNEWLAIIVGFVFGTAGTFAIWSRSRCTPDVIAAGGIARTFQNIRLLSSMSVLENVQVAIDRRFHGRARWWLLFAIFWIWLIGGIVWCLMAAIWPPGPPVTARSCLLLILPALAMLARSVWLKRREERESARQAFEILGIVGLQSRASSLAGSLAYGQQRRLEIARALALQPKIMLLDEPAAGMNPAETAELNKLIRGIRDRGITVVLIEHHMKVVMGISDRIAVLDHGVKIAEGTPAEVRANPHVIAAYLGQEEV